MHRRLAAPDADEGGGLLVGVSQSSSVGRVSRGIMHVFAGEETRAARSNAILQAANKAFKKKVGAVNRNAQL